jgi:hypothetical protein
VTSMPNVYNRSLATWRAVDYDNYTSAKHNTFLRGVRRQMGICAAVQELGSALACPAEADFADQYDELVQGFTDAAAGRESVYGLFADHDLLLGLKSDVNFLGFPSAEPALNRAISKSADRLIERAYQLCNTGELSTWGDYISGYNPTSFTGAQILDAAALCGTRMSIEGTSTVGDVRQPFGPLTVEPGDVRGTGRVQLQEITVDSLGTTQLTIKLVDSLPSRCSRVIGSPRGRESFFMRVNDVEISRYDLRPNGIYQELYINETSTIFEMLRRTPTSTDPLVIDIYRGATQVNGCTADGSGGTYSFNLPERKIYTFRLVQSSTIAGIYIGSMEFRYQEQKTQNYEDRNSVFFEVGNTSIRSSISATMVVTARITPGRPIEFLEFVPFSSSGSQVLVGSRQFTGFGCTQTIRSSISSTLDSAVRTLLLSNSLSASGTFDFGAEAFADVQTIEVNQSSDSGPAPGCNSPISTTITTRGAITKRVDVLGTGTLRGGSFTGSARGVVDFAQPLSLGSITGTGEMTVNWNLVRQ